MPNITLYLGLDVHKDSITIAIADPSPKGEVRLFGTITNSVQAIERALNNLRKAHPGAQFEVGYEAGPCGFGIIRRLRQLKVPCVVAAPSLIPKRPGAPFKNDKRDARTLARLLRGGELTAVYVPEPTDEAIRDLCRARTDAVDDLRRCRLRLKSFLLRHSYHYKGKANWSEAHMRYLRELVLPHPAMKAVLEEYLQGIDAAHQRVQRLEASMLALLETWRLKPAVLALMAFRGFQIVAAMITVSELGDLPIIHVPTDRASVMSFCLHILGYRIRYRGTFSFFWGRPGFREISDEVLQVHIHNKRLVCHFNRLQVLGFSSFWAATYKILDQFDRPTRPVSAKSKMLIPFWFIKNRRIHGFSAALFYCSVVNLGSKPWKHFLYSLQHPALPKLKSEFVVFEKIFTFDTFICR